MAETAATGASRGQRTICLPITQDDSARIVEDTAEFRRIRDEAFREAPELFPNDFACGYPFQDVRMSAKQRICIRRIILKDGTASSIRPSFLMPDLTAHTDEVQAPLFLRKFGVPFWALARVFGRDPMFSYRRECTLGRARIVGTTVKVELPEDLAADEHHQTRDGQRIPDPGFLKQPHLESGIWNLEFVNPKDARTAQRCYGGRLYYSTKGH